MVALHLFYRIINIFEGRYILNYCYGSLICVSGKALLYLLNFISYTNHSLMMKQKISLTISPHWYIV